MSEVEVTDHAVVQFLSRSGLVDIDAIRAQLAAPLEPAVRSARKIGAQSYRVKVQGWRYCFRSGNVLTTCFPEAKEPSYRGPRPLKGDAR